MKVVINNCFGGFSLSPAATVELWKRGGPIEATPIAEYWKSERDPNERFGSNEALREWRAYQAQSPEQQRARSFITVFSPDESLVLSTRPSDEQRNNALLVQLVEEMGEAANGACAKLKIVEVPDDYNWEIAEYDGNEHVAEKHRSWG